MLGFLFGGISKGTKGDEDTKPQNYLTSYFNTLYQLRILLRSLAARPETSTDSYCTLVYWSASSTAHAHALARSLARTRARADRRAHTHTQTLPPPPPPHPRTILVEIWTVILPAYLPFLCPLVLQFYFEGSLQNISKLYVVFVIVFRFIGARGPPA